MEKVIDKFLRYVAIETTSDPESESFPSTARQFNLLNLLLKEFKELNITAELDRNGYLMATVPSNMERKCSTIGFIAHADTSPDMSGKNIKPNIVQNYDGKDVILNKEKGIVLSVNEFPELKDYTGQTLITTDGTTLLGADDKAGIAEIMCAVEYMVAHPEFKHGEVKIGITPDEEIGRGVDFFDVKKFGADYAYTMDGGAIGELEYENFNAASAKAMIKGCNIHPGYAKNKMKNALLIGMEFNSLLPVEQRPEFTENYEGFIHITNMGGSVEECEIKYIIRDHSFEKFEQKKKAMERCAEFINSKYGASTVKLEIKDQYYNMKKEIIPHFGIIETAIKAMEMAGIKPRIQPIRGGTDGARLSFMGLPCPNIFAGGHNFHGKMEYVPVESMEKATEVILNIISLFARER